jgi:phage terminase small subunit
MTLPTDGFDLTFKQRIFCERYLKDYNGSAAAVEAGYSKHSAREIAKENLTKPAIQKYLGVRMKEAIAKAQVGLDWRLEILKKTADACLDGKADKDGCVDAKGVIGVVSEINKMNGDYASVTSNVNVSASNLEEATEIASDSEKEINEIKTF